LEDLVECVWFDSDPAQELDGMGLAESLVHIDGQEEQFSVFEREIELFGKQEESVDEFLQDEILPEQRGDLGRIAIGQRNLKGGFMV